MCVYYIVCVVRRERSRRKIRYVHTHTVYRSVLDVVEINWYIRQ